MQKGFDRTRPAVGICVRFTSEEGKAALLRHNHRFTKGNKLLPPIRDDAIYGSLACSHLNVCLRIIQSGLRSPVGDLQGLLAENELQGCGPPWP